MILYFSATGNSKYVALKTAEMIEDEAVDLFDRIRNSDRSPVCSEKPFVIVCPTYAWQIPHFIADLINETEFKGNKKIYTIMTCGGEIGNAGEYLKELYEQKGLEYCGCTGILMPDNYLVMFNTPDVEKSKKIVSDSQTAIISAAQCIKNGKKFAEPKVTALDKLYSGIINKMFYKTMIKTKPFYATGACVSCGKCKTVCPLANVKLREGKPVWGDECTHCMACICSCPQNAIEYGKKTKGKVRYRFPEDT